MKKIKVKREKSTATKGYYVRNVDLLPAIIEAKEKGTVTNKLIKLIWLIAERYSRKGNFVNYSFREDMVSAAVENLCKNALKFDIAKYDNPFSYYTTAINNSFLQFIADEKKHRNLRDALLVDAGSNPSFNFLQDEKDESAEIKDSDDLVLVIPKTDVEGQDKPVEETEPAVSREEKIRYKNRAPGAVLKLSAGDFVLDPVTNTYLRKVAQPTVVEPVKPARKPRAKKVVNEIAHPSAAVKEKATAVKKKPTTTPAKKKVTAKKTAPPKPPVKKAAPKPAAKKVAAKKTAVKTTKKK